MNISAPYTLDITFIEANCAVSERFPVLQLVIAGWTGRDRAAVERHIEELAAMGVARPASTPIFYRLSPTRLSTADMLQVPGQSSSGEVEFVVVQWHGKLWVGVGSDHTDRAAETYNVTMSKQMCDKPVARQFWSFDEVAAHWDRLRLRSFIREDEARVLYQDGSVADIIHPLELISAYSEGRGLTEGSVMFCGTFAAKGGIRPAPRFDFEMIDPELGRTIAHSYGIQSLPMFA